MENEDDLFAAMDAELQTDPKVNLTSPPVEGISVGQPVPADAKPVDNNVGGVGSVVSGAISGGAGAIDGIFDTASQGGALVGEGIKTIAGVFGLRDDIERTFAPAARALQSAGVVDEKGRTSLVEVEEGVRVLSKAAPLIPEIRNDETIAGQLSHDLTKILVGFKGINMVAKRSPGGFGRAFGAPAKTTTGRLAQEAGKGVVADIAVFDAYDARLSNLADDLGVPLAGFLAADEDDGVFEATLKQALEGAGLGLLFDATFHGFKALRRKTKGDIDGAALEVDKADAAFDQAADTVAQDTQLRLPLEQADEAANARASEDLLPAERGEAPNAENGFGAGTGSGRIFADTAKSQDFVNRLIDKIKKEDAGQPVRDEYDPLADLNLENIDDRRGYAAATQAMSEAFREAHRVARGTDVLSMDAVDSQARDLARDVFGSAAKGNREEMEALLASQTANMQELPFQIMAMRQMNEAAKGRVLRDLERINAGDQTIDAKQSVLSSIQLMTETQTALKGQSSNIARALRVLQERVTDTGEFDGLLTGIRDKDIVDALDPTGNSSDGFEAWNKMTTRLGRAARARNGSAMHMAIDAQSRLGRAAKVTETVYTASLLSNPGTQVVNFLGGFMMTAMQPIERALGGLATGDRALARQGLDQFMATFASLPEAVRHATRAGYRVRGQLEGSSGGFLDEAQSGDIGSKSIMSSRAAEKNPILATVLDGLNVATRAVYGQMAFADETVRQMTFLGDTRARALREGREAGLKDDALSDFVDDEMFAARDPDTGAARTVPGQSQFVNQQGIDQARSATFQEALPFGSMSYHVEKAIRKVPLSRVMLAPFLRTPLNILKAQIRRTPGLNLALQEVRDDLAGVNGREAAQVARGQYTMGAALYGMGFMLAHEGHITGTGPSDPMKGFYLDNSLAWSPLAYKSADGTYLPFGRMDPVAGFFGLAASSYTAFAYGDEDAATDASMKAVVSFMVSMRDKSYLQGIDDFMSLISGFGDSEARGKAFEKFLGQKAAGFIPSAAVAAGRDFNSDLQLRVADSFQDEVKRRLGTIIPSVAEDVDRRFDPILHVPLTDKQGRPSHLLNVFSATRDPRPEWEQELYRQIIASDSFVDVPPRQRRGVDLKELKDVNSGRTAWDRFSELTGTIKHPEYGGKTLSEAYKDLVESDRYLALTDPMDGEAGGKMREILAIRSDYRDLAWDALVAENPDVRQAVGDQKFLKLKLRSFTQDDIRTEQGIPDQDAFINLYVD